MEILNYKLFKLLKSIKDWRSLMDLIEFEKKVVYLWFGVKIKKFDQSSIKCLENINHI